jgi:hypothetical protein
MKEFGLTVKDFKIVLGETREEVEERLTKAKIRYTVPFDRTNENNVKETIIHIGEYGIELSIENDIVNYIKSHSTTSNNIHKINLGSTMSVAEIKKVITEVAKQFNVSEEDITIRRIRLNSADIVMIIRDDRRVRVHLMSDLSGNIYVSTLKYVSYAG